MIPKKEHWTRIPFSHIQIPDYIDSSNSILDYISNEEFILKRSDLFSMYQTNSLLDRDYLKELLKKIKQDIEASTEESFSSIDVHSSLYSDCNFLLPHDDMLDSRRYAYLLYLTDVPKVDGGALVLFDNKCRKVITRIQPEAFSLVVFEVSKISFHAVEEVLSDIQRIALGGWVHE